MAEHHVSREDLAEPSWVCHRHAGGNPLCDVWYWRFTEQTRVIRGFRHLGFQLTVNSMCLESPSFKVLQVPQLASGAASSDGFFQGVRHVVESLHLRGEFRDLLIEI